MNDCKKLSLHYERELNTYNCLDCYLWCAKDGSLETVLNGTVVPSCAVSSGRSTLKFSKAPRFLMSFNYKWPAYKDLKFNAGTAMMRFEGRK